MIISWNVYKNTYFGFVIKKMCILGLEQFEKLLYEVLKENHLMDWGLNWYHWCAKYGVLLSSEASLFCWEAEDVTWRMHQFESSSDCTWIENEVFEL